MDFLAKKKFTCYKLQFQPIFIFLSKRLCIKVWMFFTFFGLVIFLGFFIFWFRKFGLLYIWSSYDGEKKVNKLCDVLLMVSSNIFESWTWYLLWYTNVAGIFAFANSYSHNLSLYAIFFLILSSVSMKFSVSRCHFLCRNSCLVSNTAFCFEMPFFEHESSTFRLVGLSV
jgi:hypothetical protein